MQAGENLSELSISDSRWLSFVERCSGATIFHHPAWINVIAETYGYLPFIATCLNKDGQVLAGIPFFSINSLFADKRWVALPFSDHCQPLCTVQTALNELTSRVREMQMAAEVKSVELRWPLSAETGFRTQSQAVIHYLKLSDDTERLHAGLTQMHRRNIRKAEKEGVRVVSEVSMSAIRQFYGLHIRTRQRLGMPVQPWRFFRLLWEHIISNNLGFILLAYRDAQVIAGAVFLTWNGNLIYKYGASDLAFSDCRPNNLIFWTAIQWGCEHGYRVLDFGRTDIDNRGLRDFKSGWGAVEMPLVYSYLGAEPQIRRLGLLKSTISKTIQHTHPIVCRTIGELFYGYFG